MNICSYVKDNEFNRPQTQQLTRDGEREALMSLDVGTVRDVFVSRGGASDD